MGRNRPAHPRRIARYRAPERQGPVKRPAIAFSTGHVWADRRQNHYQLKRGSDMIMTVMLAFAAQAAPVAVPAKVKDPKQRICHTVYLAESRIPQRDCRTRAEWDELER